MSRCDGCGLIPDYCACALVVRDDFTRHSLGWHVISGGDLLLALRRVGAGEFADLVYAELWANAERETIE